MFHRTSHPPVALPSAALASTAAIALPALTRRRATSLFEGESGAATTEYAIATMATVVEQKHT